jgi:hypothetical protein
MGRACRAQLSKLRSIRTVVYYGQLGRVCLGGFGNSTPFHNMLLIALVLLVFPFQYVTCKRQRNNQNTQPEPSSSDYTRILVQGNLTCPTDPSVRAQISIKTGKNGKNAVLKLRHSRYKSGSQENS